MIRALFAVTILAALGSGTLALKPTFSPFPGAGSGPKQPINFSHQTHAGKLAMNCLYCHYGAEKSPIANLPPVGTCMGCHKIAVADRPEIQKLAGFFERGEHGPCNEMPVMYAYAPMKMGWCVTCHRQDMKNPRDPQHPASLDCIVCHH
jgi:hypothetical protein